MALVHDDRPTKKQLALTFLFPALFLCGAYSLLALTLLQHPGNLMDRCVLMNLNFARIWSVAHIEIGMSYIGVFLGMAYYLIRAGRVDQTHFRDLALGFAYLIGSFTLDYFCVQYFTPFRALLIGDAVVMTFTFLVSKQLWFQRLLGIFVPLVFLTCALGHLMEGMSFWQLTYPANVPWTMVTADIGFAILVNATRFPAFIRGHEIENEVATVKAEAKERQQFLTDVLSSVTDGKLRLAMDRDDLPHPLPLLTEKQSLTAATLGDFRHAVARSWMKAGYADDREPDVVISVGEAAMNAVVHGHNATAFVCGDVNTFQIWVVDEGPGIKLDRLPRATLERGYSTAGSLGHGFWIILQAVDMLTIHTSPSGTTALLTFHRSKVTREFSFLK